MFFLQDRRERRRRDRNGLRGIWHGIWRNNSEHEHASSSTSPGTSASSARPAAPRHSFSEAGSAQHHQFSPSSEAPSSRLQSPFANAEPPLTDYQVCLHCLSTLHPLRGVAGAHLPICKFGLMSKAVLLAQLGTATFSKLRHVVHQVGRSISEIPQVSQVA